MAYVDSAPTDVYGSDILGAKREHLVWLLNDRTSSSTVFQQSDIIAGTVAGEMSGSSKFGKGTDTNEPAGVVVGVGTNKDSNGYPYKVQVALVGVSTGIYSIKDTSTSPVINLRCIIDGTGKVKTAGSIGDGGAFRVIERDSTNSVTYVSLT